MQPVEIPDHVGIQGAEKHVIKGGQPNVNDVEALVGRLEGVPFFAMYIECDDIDLRSLAMDRHFWHFQMGVPLHPFRMETAFVSAPADGDDATTGMLQRLGEALGKAWHEHATGDQEGQLRRFLTEIETLARMAYDRETLRVRNASQLAASIGADNMRLVTDAKVNGVKVGEVVADLEERP